MFIKAIFFLIVIYLAISFTYRVLFKKLIVEKIDNEALIKLLMSNSTMSNNSELLDLFNINFNDPSFLLKKSLANLIKVDATVFFEHNDEYYEYEELETKTQYFPDPNPSVVNNPLVYIYNTHQLENYAATYLEAYNIQPNVMLASYLLKEKLNSLGIPSIVETNDVTEILRVNSWQYKYSYKASRYFIDDMLEKNKSIAYLIDIHRDSAKKDKTLTVIDGVAYARVLFVVGLEHENYKYNLEITEKLNNLIKKEDPSLTRGILRKQGRGVNGIYNQDAHKNAVLIEIGGVDNTIDEVANTVNMLAKILFNFIKENS